MRRLRGFLSGLILSFLFAFQALAGVNEELFRAIEKGNLALVKQLISKGADVNAKDELEMTPLEAAVEKGNLSIVKYLVAKGADVNSKNKLMFGWTPLHFAAERSLEVVKYLVSKGADVNAKDENGQTPLFWQFRKERRKSLHI